MQCSKLKSFLSASCSWRKRFCQAAPLPYVPSLEELEKYFSSRHSQCRRVEFDTTQAIFTLPKKKEPEDYITGRFG